MALTTGLDEDAKKAVLRGVSHGGEHLSKALKFVTVRKEHKGVKSGLTLIGGPHDPKLDGAISASTKCVIVLSVLVGFGGWLSKM